MDLLLLKDRFAHYKNSRKKIFDLTQKGYLFLIKRSHYLNFKSEEFKEVQLECFANVLYFPSYISAEWALQYYGLLTDRVQTITSVTTRRSQQFKTPMGVFAFEHLDKRRYPYGYFMQTSNQKSFLIARPDKALLDYVNLRIKKINWKTKEDIARFLLEDVRINLKTLLELIKQDELRKLLDHYHRNSKEARLLKWLISQKEKSHGSSA
ncbi:MAG: hypothetical protein HYY62_00175 [Deltaproteobacteria bacterium]|nr:hypothetical protein [Deltaproteobacteria bacterium]